MQKNKKQISSKGLADAKAATQSGRAAKSSTAMSVGALKKSIGGKRKKRRTKRRRKKRKSRKSKRRKSRKSKRRRKSKKRKSRKRRR